MTGNNHNNRLAIHFENNIIRISFISELPLNEEKIFKTDIADFNRIVDELYSLYQQIQCPYEILMYFDEFNNDKVILVDIYEEQ